MSIKTALASRLINYMLSERRQRVLWSRTEEKRERRSVPHKVEYFHQVDDPYSHLMLQLLPKLVGKYDIEVSPYLVPPPDDWAAPEREKLVAYSRLDAHRLAAKSGGILNFPYSDKQPNRASILQAENDLEKVFREANPWAAAHEVSGNMWADTRDGGIAVNGNSRISVRLEEGAKRRKQLGHYLGGVLAYGGELYWGPDRLHHLERRLTLLGALREPIDATVLQSIVPDFEPTFEAQSDRDKLTGPNQELHFYLSFRSPYTYLAVKRVKRLADKFGAKLCLRFVLPMVMRNLPVRREKGFYIMKDAAREARHRGLPFGRVADPVGRPTERAYSLLPWAIEEGRGYEYCDSFLTAVWSRGVDAGSDTGLRSIVDSAGLDWTQASAILGDESWKKIAEENRQEMDDLGLWGVPSFRIDETATWGQDRLWVIEDRMLKNLTGELD